METVKLTALTENKTFTIHNGGNYMMPAMHRCTINGKSILTAVWTVNGKDVLAIESHVPGSWRVDRSGKKAHRFVPDQESPFTWEVEYV